MSFIDRLILISVLSVVIVTADDTNQTLVNHYVELIQNRTRAAQSFVLPTDARMHEPENKTIEEYGEFDFIIIGAGTTGSVIASRLSEVEEWSVLLLEAGSFPDQDITRIPAMYTVDGASKFNWGYQTVPQKNFCFSSANNRCGLSRGKGVGGTSLINGLEYVRGNKVDYDKLADLLNDTSYSYENMLPYFEKIENFTQTNPNVPIDFNYHGTKGPLHMTQSIISSDLQTAILEGTLEFGLNLSDFNGKQQLGVSVMQTYVNNGFRDDPELAFIEPAKNRKNFTVLENSFVLKLDISNDTKRMNGVVFARNNKTFIARNRKDVILSAGTIGSAQILMLSGVGPEDHLNALGIPVVLNSPVGKNLRDHITPIMRFSSNATFPNQTIEEQVRDLLKGRGNLTTVFDLNVIALLKIPQGVPEDTPDIEINFRNLRSGFPNTPTTLDIKFEMFHPNSVGSLLLNSSDPFEYPLINTNALTDDYDMEVLLEGVQIVLNLTKTEPFRRFNVSLALAEVKECNQTEPLSREYWVCYLKRITRHAGHLIGTCSTGQSPETAVVDNNLRVYGITNLRVADASVIPYPFAHHTTATCGAFAEKLSDQIKKEYNKLRKR